MSDYKRQAAEWLEKARGGGSPETAKFRAQGTSPQDDMHNQKARKEDRPVEPSPVQLDDLLGVAGAAKGAAKFGGTILAQNAARSLAKKAGAAAGEPIGEALGRLSAKDIAKHFGVRYMGETARDAAEIARTPGQASARAAKIASARAAAKGDDVAPILRQEAARVARTEAPTGIQGSVQLTPTAPPRPIPPDTTEEFLKKMAGL